MGLGLYHVDNPADRASALMGGATNALGAMQKQANTKTTTEAPEKNAGGAVMAGLQGAMAGVGLAEAIPALGLSSGPAAAIMTPLAMGMYFLS